MTQEEMLLEAAQTGFEFYDLVASVSLSDSETWMVKVFLFIYFWGQR